MNETVNLLPVITNSNSHLFIEQLASNTDTEGVRTAPLVIGKPLDLIALTTPGWTVRAVNQYEGFEALGQQLSIKSLVVQAGENFYEHGLNYPIELHASGEGNPVERVFGGSVSITLPDGSDLWLRVAARANLETGEAQVDIVTDEAATFRSPANRDYRFGDLTTWAPVGFTIAGTIVKPD